MISQNMCPQSFETILISIKLGFLFSINLCAQSLYVLFRTLRSCSKLSEDGQACGPWPPWLPQTFVICPKGSGPKDSSDKDSIRSLKAKFRASQDESQAFRAAHTQVADQGGGQVWIAKSTAGAKGELR